ncbi:MAG TPA: efflux RND transporter periplasmic adaptor subunit [Actinomycetes bacterium]|nr:efflux RND transporter periplasmic adaptor subunit [Actinomycetes bacterium]
MSAPGRRAAAVLVAVATLALAGCTGGGDGDVVVAPVGRATVVEVVEAPATVAARATATLSSPADGTVAALRVHEGQQVRTGQVLLRVESPSARRDLRQAREADARASAGATAGPTVDLSGARQADAVAQRSFARARRAAERIAVPAARRQALSALRVSEAQYRSARAQADNAARQLAAGIGSLSQAVAALSSAQRVQTRAAVQLARRTVSALVVRAPVAGTVSLSAPSGGAASGGDAQALISQLPEGLQSQAGSVLGGSASGSSASVDGALVEGQPVSSGEALLTVTDASTLSLTAQVDETDVLLVRAGVPATAELDAVPDATYESGVESIDPTPTQSSRGGVTYLVRLRLGLGRQADGTSAPTPRPGMSAVVDLRVRTARHVLAVPAAAVFRDGRRDAVWVVDHGVARVRVVRLGAQGKTHVQVLDGVRPGDSIVAHGADQVHDGDSVS